MQRSTKAHARSIHGAAQLPLRADGSLRVAVVADTHGHPHPLTAARLGALSVDAILHAGDIGDLAVLDGLGRIAPVIAVRGNIDERSAAARDVPDVVTVDVLSDGESVLKMLLTHIAVAGPRVRADAARLARDAGARLIVCGHSHVPFIGRDRGLTVFNPGSIGPRRMSLPIVFGVIEIAAGKLSMKHVSCETGEDWTPPA